jgi:hypothetical protein
MLPTLNRAVKMPEVGRIPRNKTAWPGSSGRGLLWNCSGLPTSSSPQNPALGKLQMSVLTHAAPNNNCVIGSLLDIGLHLHLFGRSAGTIRKQTQSRESGGSGIPGPGSPDERERDGETGSVGYEQWQCEVTAGTRRTSTSDGSRAKRDSEMEMGTCFARDSRTGRSQI